MLMLEVWRSSVVAVADLGDGGSDHHAVSTVFQINTAGLVCVCFFGDGRFFWRGVDDY